MPSKRQYLRPRLCTLHKGDNGYGFHLHGEKGKTGQFIRLVEPDSPAECSGLRAGDRLVFVNGDEVESASHQQVVSRIRATVGPLELVVVDPETEQLLKKHNLKCLKEFVSEGLPLPLEEKEVEEVAEEEKKQAEEVVVVMKEAVEVVKEDTEVEEEVKEDTEVEEEVKEDTEVEEVVKGDTEADGTENGDVKVEDDEEEVAEQEPDKEETPRELTPVPVLPDRTAEVREQVEEKLRVSYEQESRTELRPRLCVIRRGPNGFGFNLHSERSRPGQYIRAVDEDSPAERAGLLPQDRIVEVNSLSVEGKTHSEVVAAIKAGGDVTRLLVVDPDTNAFFKRCRVTPTSEHVTGPLPEPVLNGETEEKVNGRVAKEKERNSKLSVSPSPSNASSNTSLTTPTANTPPEGLVTNAIPALNLTLQQVKELTHQKRSNKRAPPMDWTKKNELFSNL